jgi:hypothetical protein
MGATKMAEIKDVENKMISVLSSELELYQELLKLSQKKTDILVKGDVKLLDEITKIEQDMIMRMGKLEAKRGNIIKKIAETYKKDIKQINMSFLKQIMTQENIKKLENLQEDMKYTLKQIDEKNRDNERLIKQALEYIDFSVDLLKDVGHTKSNYSPDGKDSKNRAFHFIDKKA